MGIHKMTITLTGRSLVRFGEEYRIIEGDVEMTGYFKSKQWAIHAFRIAQRIFGDKSNV